MCAGLTDSQLHGEGKRIYQSIQYDFNPPPPPPASALAAVALYAPCRSNSRALTWQFALQLIFICASAAMEESVPEDCWRMDKKHTFCTSCLCRSGSAAFDLPQGDGRGATSLHQQSAGGFCQSRRALHLLDLTKKEKINV